MFCNRLKQIKVFAYMFLFYFGKLLGKCTSPIRIRNGSSTVVEDSIFVVFFPVSLLAGMWVAVDCGPVLFQEWVAKRMTFPERVPWRTGCSGKWDYKP